MRTTGKATSIVIATALTLSVAACSGGDTRVATLPGARPTASSKATMSTPSPTTSRPRALPSGWLHPTADNPLGVDWSKRKPFTGAAAVKFGPSNVMAAYRHAVTFSLQEGYGELMAKGYDTRPIEFSFVNSYLTVSAGKAWDGYVKGALARDDKNSRQVSNLTSWYATAGQDRFKFRARQQQLTQGMDFSAATTSVETIGSEEYLIMHFTVGRKLRVMDGSKAVLMPLNKDITYRMTPNGLKDIPWLIEAWNIKATGGVPTPDPMGATS